MPWKLARALAVTVTAGILVPSGDPLASDRPNVLWLTCEDISPDLGCYGNVYARTRTDRLVSFVDFAPTLLSLAGVEIPEVLQGVAFLGPRAGPPREYVYGIRDRMAERFDIVRVVRDRQYHYLRNWYPHVPWSQFTSYTEQMPTMLVWRELAEAGRPVVSADLLGDWREEVVLRTADGSALRIFVTTALTDRRLYTLMHDPQYRLSVAWQNVAYNQPPHPSFFLGDGMKPPPRPSITTATAMGDAGR